MTLISYRCQKCGFEIECKNCDKILKAILFHQAKHEKQCTKKAIGKSLKL